jgi:hypothetical protein
MIAENSVNGVWVGMIDRRRCSMNTTTKKQFYRRGRRGNQKNNWFCFSSANLCVLCGKRISTYLLGKAEYGMREITGNIWDYRETAVVAVTTNGQVTGSGRAVMGRGVAAQAARLFPHLAATLGALLAEQGNHVHYLGDNIVSFPVEHSPFENPDPRLIEQSARELAALADGRGWTKVVVPRPGCGGGGLSWNEVRPLLEPYFDERFTVITAG